MKKYILCCTILLAGLLAGCSMENKVPDPELHTDETNTKEVRELVPIANEMSTPNSVVSLPLPTYLDENKYEGDELGIVKALNHYMKACYEKDYDALNDLMSKGTEKITTGGFKKYFISFDKLDFSVKPDPTPPEGTKPVVVEFKTKIYDHKEEVEEDKQLFLFRLEDGLWKFVATADWW
ncbi:hypothetical protein [Paenibacillus radicis (ex Gao et al. 2016)]|uniref:Uncharacterized protein n=1 Tax=Paenibacillus radicis (ex Gao et al. 2016) TaxID=1737354 RepID=A0A917M2D3_9BACL|nr:hypothetical protein [Paenibacillus radicis (ex Gao et al. 2016)]GGG70612.1 hypothetical protein GCM10010918_27470 [Paenibacillus radicis (ex Gao et al. 2016)]